MHSSREAPKANVWYLAYGSNMNLDTFTGSRGIEPMDAVLVQVPGWALTMEIGGTPYVEPAFSSIRPVTEDDGTKAQEVIGVAYLITGTQMMAVVGSEGGGIAYSDILVPAEILNERDFRRVGSHLMVRTLVTAFARRPVGRPSERYMDIINDGAIASCLPLDYCQYLQAIPTFRPLNNVLGKVGAALFLGFWGPIMGLLQIITKRTLRDDGNVPAVVIMFVRFIIIIMWFVHDYIHAPVWGRGDGLEGKARTVSQPERLVWLLD